MKKSSFADILQGLSDERSGKLATKLPSLPEIEVPTALALEQCSSEWAAKYKARAAAEFCGAHNGNSALADLTGGLGIDCWAFSEHFGRLLYNDRNAVLGAAVKRNFEALGIKGVEFHNLDVSPDSTDWSDVLRAFSPDVIFLDPARRSADGRKVFLLEDCSPCVPDLLPILLDIAPKLVLKLSPMADISLIVKRLSEACSKAVSKRGLKEIKVVGLQGECKELLCFIDASFDAGCRITAVELLRDGGAISLSAPDADGPESQISPDIRQGGIMAVPSAVLMKAGLHDVVCQSAGFAKADRFTHLYFGSPDRLPLLGNKEFFKFYEIIEVMPLNNANVREAGRRHPSADVTARNIRMTSDELRLRLGIRKPSGDCHIFGFAGSSGKLLAVCRQLNPADAPSRTERHP